MDYLLLVQSPRFCLLTKTSLTPKQCTTVIVQQFNLNLRLFIFLLDDKSRCIYSVQNKTMSSVRRLNTHEVHLNDYFSWFFG